MSLCVCSIPNATLFHVENAISLLCNLGMASVKTETNIILYYVRVKQAIKHFQKNQWDGTLSLIVGESDVISDSDSYLWSNPHEVRVQFYVVCTTEKYYCQITLASNGSMRMGVGGAENRITIALLCSTLN